MCTCCRACSVSLLHARARRHLCAGSAKHKHAQAFSSHTHAMSKRSPARARLDQDWISTLDTCTQTLRQASTTAAMSIATSQLRTPVALSARPQPHRACRLPITCSVTRRQSLAFLSAIPLLWSIKPSPAQAVDLSDKRKAKGMAS